MNKTVNVIGAGLAGCEAASTLAANGISVKLYEMKPEKYSNAHHNENFAELVCSNSLKAAQINSAAGLLKEEMRLLGSLIISCAESTQVSAGGALAVNRDEFSALVTEKIKENPLIEIIHGEVTDINKDEYTIICTGPLTSDGLAEKISSLCGMPLSFYDAAAPIVKFDSIDMDIAFFQSRYDKGGADYINCPFEKESYIEFHKALCEAETVPLKEFENLRVYEGCMPIEVLANRGEDSIRFGPLKPVGIHDPKTGKRPYAVVQLRKENNAGSMYNMVGFQTNLKFPEQKRVFSMIPGLNNADFVRFGVMHRNTFIDSPRLLTKNFALKSNCKILFAGQITGVEGYVESAMSGLAAGTNLARVLSGKQPYTFPPGTMCGALINYITDESIINFQPMGANMGLLPPLAERVRDKQLRYGRLAERALMQMRECIYR